MTLFMTRKAKTVKAILGSASLLLISSLQGVMATPQSMPQHIEPKSGLQILGSGGPNDVSGRASSSNLIWIDGKAKLMIDAGGGASLRYGQAGAKARDLDAIALTHLHVDHSVDVSTIIKRGYFSPEAVEFKVIGPTGNHLYPDTEQFVDASLNGTHGGFQYMRKCVDYPIVTATQVSADQGKKTTVMETPDYTLTAMGVEHADTPTLAYRVDLKDSSYGFSGDQNGRVDDFIDLVRDVDVLVMHLPHDPGAFAQQAAAEGESLSAYWHASPSIVGKIAAKANAGTLVLTHFMANSLGNMDESLDVIKKHYSGKIVLAEDLMMIDGTNDEESSL